MSLPGGGEDATGFALHLQYLLALLNRDQLRPIPETLKAFTHHSKYGAVLTPSRKGNVMISPCPLAVVGGASRRTGSMPPKSSVRLFGLSSLR